MDPKLSDNAVDFIDEGRITALLEGGTPDRAGVREIVAKSLEKKALQLDETAVLLRAEDPELVEEIFQAARTPWRSAPSESVASSQWAAMRRMRSRPSTSTS